MWIKRHTIYAIESVYMQTGVHTIKPSHSLVVLLHIVSLNAYVTPHFSSYNEWKDSEPKLLTPITSNKNGQVSNRNLEAMIGQRESNSLNGWAYSQLGYPKGQSNRKRTTKDYLQFLLHLLFHDYRGYYYN
jgi:hypothetical protein